MLKNVLTQTADDLKKEAEILLKETSIVPIFSSLGKVNFVGSYQLNTMYRPDIDLIVIAEKPKRQKAVEITSKLLKSNNFQTVGFADCFNFKKKNTPKGFYWELVVPRFGKNWKFDVWYTTADEDYSIEPTKRFEQLLKEKPPARETILKVKQTFFNGTKYRHGITGPQIYTAVLEKGIEDMEEFKKDIRLR
jgi:hypothetical protein